MKPHHQFFKLSVERGLKQAAEDTGSADYDWMYSGKYSIFTFCNSLNVMTASILIR